MARKLVLLILLLVIATLPMACIGDEETSDPTTVPLHSAFPSFLTNVSGTLFFMADDGVTGRELWKSDGTAGGTVLVKDINPGAGDSSPDTNSLAAMNGMLFFGANEGTHGVELWMSDGTAAGTVLVKDINSGGNSTPTFLTVVNNTVFFMADDGVHGRELWKSDGTDTGTTCNATTGAGTCLVKDINPGTGGSVPSVLTAMNGTLFFVADDGVTGRELWKSDGTDTGATCDATTGAGTCLVKDISLGPVDSFPTSLVVMNSLLYFAATDGLIEDGRHGRELWRSDGTGAGTVLVKDINPNTDPGVDDGWSSPSFLTNVNGTLFFSANDGSSHGVGLWKSDGTDAGSSWIKEFAPLGADPGTLYFAALNGSLLFEADDGLNGVELWKSDGTDTGTVMVKNIRPGQSSSGPTFLNLLGDTVFFTANDGVHEVELWKSDGTDFGATCETNPYGVAVDTTTTPNRLYVAKFASGTVSVLNASTNTVIASVPVGTNPNGVAVNSTTNRAYVANFGSNSVSVLDTNANTVIANVPVGTNPNGVAVNSAANRAYVTNSGSNSVSVLDTNANTVIATVTVGTNPNGVAVDSAANRVYVTNSGSNSVSVLDTTTNPPTVSAPVAVGTNPAGVAVDSAANRVYVTNSGSNSVSVLDTTTNPPTVSASLPVGTNPTGVAVDSAANRVYVTNSGSNSVSVLDTTTNPPTVSATVTVGTNPRGVAVNTTTNLTYVTNFASNSVSVLNALTNPPTVSTTLPVSGTCLVKDIYPPPAIPQPSPATSNPFGFAQVNGVLYFAADDGPSPFIGHGNELWKSDGTPAGTVLVKDIYPP